MPAFAPSPTPTISAVGVARPSAHGQAITSTAVARIRAAAQSPESKPFATSVTAAMASTAGTNRADTRSASRWTGAFEPCAAATCRTIAASSVEAPTAVARQRSGPPSLTVPASTTSPGAFATGSLSPVSIASFTADSPSSTWPSNATLSPARTTNTSPTRTAASGNFLHFAVALASNRRRLQLEEVANGVGRPGARAPFEELAEEDERDDDGTRFEIHVLARQRHEPDSEAQQKRGGGAQRNQHVHVGGAAAQRLP